MHSLELTIVGRSVFVCSCASPCVAAQVSFARGLGTRTSSFPGSSRIGSCTCPSAAKRQTPTLKTDHSRHHKGTPLCPGAAWYCPQRPTDIICIDFWLLERVKLLCIAFCALAGYLQLILFATFITHTLAARVVITHDKQPSSARRLKAQTRHRNHRSRAA